MQAAADGTREPMLLFYANQDITGTPFLQEIVALTQRGFPFKFIPTLTRPSEGWTGERGHVDAAMLSRHLVPSEASYYVSGSPAMVEATKEMLAGIGVGANRILSEKLEGY